jgi:hypothetical protein
MGGEVACAREVSSILPEALQHQPAHGGEGGHVAAQAAVAGGDFGELERDVELAFDDQRPAPGGVGSRRWAVGFARCSLRESFSALSRESRLVARWELERVPLAVEQRFSGRASLARE